MMQFFFSHLKKKNKTLLRNCNSFSLDNTFLETKDSSKNSLIMHQTKQKCCYVMKRLKE